MVRSNSSMFGLDSDLRSSLASSRSRRPIATASWLGHARLAPGATLRWLLADGWARGGAGVKWRLALAVFAHVWMPRSLHAETDLEAVDLRYSAPASCPSAAEFLAEIQRSSARLRVATPSAAARRFEVVIEPSGLHGHLAIDGGTLGERDAHGADCAEVSRLLAFAAALAADPDARLPEEASSDPAPPPAPSTSPLAPAPGPTPQSPPAQRPVADPRSASRRVPVESHARSNSTPLRWATAGFGLAKSASAPGLTPGAGAFAELSLPRVLLAPMVRFGAGYAAKTVLTNEGHVSLANYFMMLELCSKQRAGERWALLPCLRAQGGDRIAAGNDDLPNHHSAARGFLELGLAGYVRVHLASRLFAELGGALLFPATLDRVVIDPNQTTVYQVPRLGSQAELALGVEFGDQTGN
jgi:hypothetical protein